MKTLLVLGRSGQVAGELARLGPPQDWRLIFLGRDEFDLLRDEGFDRLLRETGAAAVINTAAYTAVDQAETEPQAAFRLNRDAPGMLAQACARADVPLVHFSTDYVFDGTKPSPYVETDAKTPVSVYGQSKSEGEDAVLAASVRSAVLRTSWVYAARGANFVRTMLRLADERDEVRVVGDQTGRPTWAKDCAEAAMLAVQALVKGEDLGVLNVAGRDDATWAQVAEAIFAWRAARGLKRPKLTVITTAEYPTAARRPANSRLDTTKIGEVLGWQARPWRYSLAACLDEIERAQ